ncbi:hypothetical protein EF888_05800 [Silicimonas algicola]|uniref:Ribosomal protein L11 methyltransferase PrmA n=1 Tax=Silicimonas algicola TaxID=1826607 RepID=A0A316GDK2_9RHOB|nr:class I SAM-dependent methyltransferase [Silicimonas algicola]AZQ66697.1 hypothetical protein EF888_05800 [Silicimonas algicola]PWK59051.1 ribosomal protein L11 methyltransferase PrmA [Silicimonas algicola]
MLAEHLSYVEDVQRTRLFTQAVERVVKANDDVLDLGCGVGILGLLCLQGSAKSVIGVDKTAIVEIASRVYAVVSRTKRSGPVRMDASRFLLSDRVDLIVCDHVGYFGLDYGILKMLKDARRRFLKMGGRIVPQGLGLHLAPVGGQQSSRIARGWTREGIPAGFHALNAYTVNTKHAVELRLEDVLGLPALLGEIDFMTETRESFSYKAELTITRGGKLEGLAGWFDCTLCEGVTMTNSPLRHDRINRSQAFFPIEEAIEVSDGDRLRVTMAMRPDENVFAWTLEHVPTGRRFRQSTLQGEILDADDLRRARPDHVPVPTVDARAGAIVLGYCDGRLSLREIEEAVLHDHPDLFPTPEAIRDFVRSWLAGWTR